MSANVLPGTPITPAAPPVLTPLPPAPAPADQVGTPVPRGQRLQVLNELLQRQVNPGWIQDGRITSQAFVPYPVDHGLLSVSRSSLTEPEAAYALFTGRGRSSVGVTAVAVNECHEAGLQAYSDPEDEPGLEDPAHAVIDFRELAEKERKRRAKILAAKAQQRGFVYRPAQ